MHYKATTLKFIINGVGDFYGEPPENVRVYCSGALLHQVPDKSLAVPTTHKYRSTMDSEFERPQYTKDNLLCAIGWYAAEKLIDYIDESHPLTLRVKALRANKYTAHVSVDVLTYNEPKQAVLLKMKMPCD